MGTLGHAVGTAGQGFGRQVPMEAQMGPMGFIDEDIEAFFMGIGREGLQVTGNAVVSRIGEDDGLGLGMGGDSPLQTVQVRSQ